LSKEASCLGALRGLFGSLFMLCRLYPAVLIASSLGDAGKLGRVQKMPTDNVPKYVDCGRHLTFRTRQARPGGCRGRSRVAHKTGRYSRKYEAPYIGRGGRARCGRDACDEAAGAFSAGGCDAAVAGGGNARGGGAGGGGDAGQRGGRKGAADNALLHCAVPAAHVNGGGLEGVRGQRVARACPRAVCHVFFCAVLTPRVPPRLFAALRSFFNVSFSRYSALAFTDRAEVRCL